MTILHPISVTTKRQTDGRLLYRVRGDNGQTYVTFDALKAALCQRAVEQGLAIKVWSSPGWYYRDLDRVALVDAHEKVS